MWRVPKMWEGGDVYILGGGPSVIEQFGIPEELATRVRLQEESPSVYSPYLAPLHNKHVIGINAAYLIGKWIDLVFFGDNRFFLANRKELAQFPGLKVSCNPGLNSPRFKGDNIKYLARDSQHSKGITPHLHKVSWNGNSGAAAISIAAHAGAARIILLGFDMKLDEEQNQHWHNEYKVGKRALNNPKALPFHRHLPGFEYIARDAKQRGIEIINACPDSAITQFRKVTVKELLNGQFK